MVVSPGRPGSARMAALAAVLKEATGVEPYWYEVIHIYLYSFNYLFMYTYVSSRLLSLFHNL